MAGIGFELKKLLNEDNLSSVLKVAVSGIMIVAGPWILSILGITFINKIAGASISENPTLFTAAIIYSYAFSLIIFGGFHYIITRYIADLLYEKKYNDSTSVMLLSSIIIFIVSVLISFIASFRINVEIQNAALFKISGILLFSTINLIWIIMLFISLLKWYMKILIIYLGGMSLSVLFVILLGPLYKTAGALLGFTLGHIIIFVSLLLISIKAYPPNDLISKAKPFLKYFKKYYALFFTGLFYYLGIWVDKLFYWSKEGSNISGTFFTLYEKYDILVYFSNLSMIPGLVYFVVIAETGFYILLSRFLLSLNKDKFIDIQKSKYSLITGLKDELKNQNLFQGLISITLIVLSAEILGVLGFGAEQVLTFKITLGAVFFHLLFLTLLNYLFYFELYNYTFFVSFVFFFTNLVSANIYYSTSLLSIPGLSYMTAGIVSSIIAWFLLKSSIRKIDRIIFSKFS